MEPGDKVRVKDQPGYPVFVVSSVYLDGEVVCASIRPVDAKGSAMTVSYPISSLEIQP